MLGTLLEKLGALLPKSIFIGSFLPMFIFALLNGLMLYWYSETFFRWTEWYSALDAGRQAFYGLPLLVGIATLAYIFSILNLSLRQILEGRYLPQYLSRILTSGQQNKLDKLQAKLDEYKKERRHLKISYDVWEDSLQRARSDANSQTALCTYSESETASQSIKALVATSKRHERIDAGNLEEAVAQLRVQLSKYPVDQVKPGGSDAANKLLLDEDHNDLLAVTRYARDSAEERYVDLFNQKDSRYSRFRVAPTAIGNVAESFHGYARSRYEMDLDSFWSRLEKIIQSDKEFYGSLLDSKTQLDFMVALFWLTVIFSVIWISYLLYAGQSIPTFLAIGVAGPFLTWLWYRIALQNYLAFADTFRTAIDLYRLDLLKALHIRLPSNAEEERKVWAGLNQLIGYGDDVAIEFDHAKE